MQQLEHGSAALEVPTRALHEDAGRLQCALRVPRQLCEGVVWALGTAALGFVVGFAVVVVFVFHLVASCALCCCCFLTLSAAAGIKPQIAHSHRLQIIHTAAQKVESPPTSTTSQVSAVANRQRQSRRRRLLARHRSRQCQRRERRRRGLGSCHFSFPHHC
mmetsp:Transcript_68851/g.135291  ORF Transcript_68851/g.135291 Transcript_68851/m.135291 type:complete len:161 (-) Transcript_68851:46-528(-)